MKDEHEDQPLKPEASVTGRAQRDIVMLGIATAALILFVGTGGTVLPQIVKYWLGTAKSPDVALTNALLLNIALIIFGWRRYAELEKEVNERRKAEAYARLLAETDALTGCYNRRSIVEAARPLFESAARKETDVAVLMLDLDNFKQINDIHGHRVGDKVLVEVSGRLRHALPADAILARIGGDELAIALPFAAGVDGEVEDLAVDLISIISRPQTIDATTLEVTASIGIATMRDVEDIHVERPEGAIGPLLHRADMAMYYAKQNGRNAFAWFDPSMESELRFRNELEAGIRSGVSHGEFVPYYEQQIDIASGKLVGFEMLARWQSPKLGLVSPEVFIPIAEDIGVITDLSEGLIRQALEDAKGWDPELTLSVNISPVQLRDPWFAQRILRILTEAGFPPSRLEIEITESALQENLPLVRSTLCGLKNQGIRISLDDFGTGYSNLSRLSDLPFDQIKIDRSFVMELAKENANPTIVESIISLGKGLDLPLTAEGIESPEVLMALQKLGKFKGQGYLYGLPEDANTTRERLDREHRLAAPNAGEVTEAAAPLTAAEAAAISQKLAS